MNGGGWVDSAFLSASGEKIRPRNAPPKGSITVVRGPMMRHVGL